MVNRSVQSKIEGMAAYILFRSSAPHMFLVILSQCSVIVLNTIVRMMMMMIVNERHPICAIDLKFGTHRLITLAV